MEHAQEPNEALPGDCALPIFPPQPYSNHRRQGIAEDKLEEPEMPGKNILNVYHLFYHTIHYVIGLIVLRADVVKPQPYKLLFYYYIDTIHVL